MYKSQNVFAVMVIVNLILLNTFSQALAEKVYITGLPKDGFARLQFVWTAPVPYVARILDGDLVLNFARSIETNYSVPRNMSRYIGSPTFENHRKTMIFPLKNKFGLNFNSRNNIVTIDLMDLEPHPSPEYSMRRKIKMVENVQVRTGLHRNYGRIVFDWPNKVSYTFDSKKNGLVLSFDRLAKLNYSMVNSRHINENFAVTSRHKNGKTIVSIKLSPEARIRHFASGNKIVVDVFKHSSSVKILNEPKSAADTKKEVNQQKKSKRLVFNSKENNLSKTVSGRMSVTPPSDLTRIELGIKGKKRLFLQGAATKPITIDKITENKILRSLKSPSFIGLSRASAQTTNPKALSPSTGGTGQKVISVRLDWTEPVAAAVFRRAGALWIVFDKAKNFDMEKIKSLDRNFILSADQVAAPRGTFIRLSTPSGVNPSIKRDGFAWIIDLKKQSLTPKNMIVPKLQRTVASGPRIFLPMVQAGEALPFRDAAVGDNLVIIPVIPLSNGVPKRHVYQEVAILPSLQGMVIQPKVDDIFVRSTSKGVQVFSVSKLALSPPDPKAAAQSRIRTIKALKRTLGSDIWRLAKLGGITKFNETKRNLMAGIAMSRGKARRDSRLRLAHYLFGQNFGYELIGVLRRIQEEDANIEETGEFRLLRGGANFLVKRYKEAEKDLNHFSLNESDEGRFWRAINQAGSGALKEAAPALKETGKLILAYPKRIKLPLGLLIAESAVQAGDVELATNYLQLISEEEPSPKELDQLALVEGKLQQLVGDFDAAVEAWDSVAEGEHRPSIADAVVRKVELQLLSKKLKTKGAIKLLEKARFSWRGDDLELTLLWKLGRLYLQAEDYRNGLRTLRSAGSYFGAHPSAPKITEEMSGAFVNLYLKDVADSMSPVQAIGLYEEFKELTPAGEQGDVMIQKLADRLAQVDLLDKAAKLLMQQVDFRLTGQEKARVGARLATLRILNKQPAMASDAITRSDGADITPYLEAQRRQLLARSYIDQGLDNKALATLGTDTNKYSDLLRVEIFWKARKWSQASQALDRLIRSSGANPKGTLDEQQAQYVLNRAVSMALGGDLKGTLRIARTFMKAMDKTNYKDAFRLIASQDSAGLIDIRSIENKVKIVSNFRGFMSSYKRKLKDGKLSQLN